MSSLSWRVSSGGLMGRRHAWASGAHGESCATSDWGWLAGRPRDFCRWRRRRRRLLAKPFHPSIHPSFRSGLSLRAPREPELVARRARLRGGAVLGELGHLALLEGGILVFADHLEQPITLQARSILLKDGGALYMGTESCPYCSKAVISLYDKATKGNEVEGNEGKKFWGVGRGGILKLHSRKPRSWTLLNKTLNSGALWCDPYASEKHRSDRGLNVQIVNTDMAWVVAASRFNTHLLMDENQRLWGFLSCQPLGRGVAIAVGDSVVKSLTLETRCFLRDLLLSEFILHLGYRQPWAGSLEAIHLRQ